MSVLQSLYDNLRQAGIEVTIEAEKTNVLSQLNPLRGMMAQRMGKVVLKERPIEEIGLYGHWEKHRSSSFGSTLSKDRLESVDVGYLISAAIKGNKKDLEARLNVKRTGLVNRKVTEMGWEGGALAARLNADKLINDLLWQSIGQLSAKDIKIKLDEDVGKAEIYVSDDRQVLSGKLPPVELYEMIAQHVLVLAGVTGPGMQSTPAPVPKAVPTPQRDTAQQAVSAAPATSEIKHEAAKSTTESSAVKYCFNCGTKMPQDAVFCPQCGNRQDG